MPPFFEIDQNIILLPSFTLECGEILRDVPVAYKTWGELNEQRDNVMIICHAFTGSADLEDWCVLLLHLRFSSPLHLISFPLMPCRSLIWSAPEPFYYYNGCVQPVGGVR